MSLKSTVLIKTLGMTCSNTPLFVPRISWGKVVEVVDGRRFWLVTYFVGSVVRFLVVLRGITFPTKIARKELQSLIYSHIVKLEKISWGLNGSLVADVTVGQTNVNDYMIQQGLTNSLGLANSSGQDIDDWDIV